jgi:chemotaxis signal transduction protein
MLRVGRSAESKKRGPKSAARAHLLVSVGDFRFALPAEMIEEVRSVETITPRAFIDPMLQKFCGTIMRDREEHYVVDPTQLFGIVAGKLSRVVLFRERSGAMLVDEVDRMHDAVRLPLPEIFRGAERKWYSGLAHIGEQVVPILHINGLISVVELSMLRAAGEDIAAKGATA